MDLRLDVNPEKLTLNDLIFIEEASAENPRRLRDFLAKLVVDDSGAEVDQDAAQELIGNMPMSDLATALEQVGEAVSSAASDAMSGEANGS